MKAGKDLHLSIKFRFNCYVIVRQKKRRACTKARFAIAAVAARAQDGPKIISSRRLRYYIRRMDCKKDTYTSSQLTSDGQWPFAAVLTTVVAFAVIYTDSDGGKISELLLSLVYFILSFDIDFRVHLSISFDDSDDDDDNDLHSVKRIQLLWPCTCSEFPQSEQYV